MRVRHVAFEQSTNFIIVIKSGRWSHKEETEAAFSGGSKGSLYG